MIAYVNFAYRKIFAIVFIKLGIIITKIAIQVNNQLENLYIIYYLGELRDTIHMGVWTHDPHRWWLRVMRIVLWYE